MVSTKENSLRILVTIDAQLGYGVHPKIKSFICTINNFEMQDSAVRKLCLGQHVNFHQAGVRSKGQGLKEELQFRAMLELQMLVHVRIVCNLQKVALKNSKFQKQSKETTAVRILILTTCLLQMRHT